MNSLTPTPPYIMYNLTTNLRRQHTHTQSKTNASNSLFAPSPTHPLSPLPQLIPFSHSTQLLSTMENLGEHLWETAPGMFFPTQDFESWGLDEALSGYYDSSSPDGAATSAASKNIVSERNRRKKLNERLFALRSVVPNISKMDKASIIKDAIDYIEQLHEQEKRIEAEIKELESGMPKKSESYEYEQEQLPVLLRSKKKRTDQQLYGSGSSRNFPIELLELRVTYMKEKIVVVNLICSKRTDTMVKLCEVFESLKLKIITATITSISGKLRKTLVIEANEEEKDHLQIRIQTAIAALNDPLSPMSI